MERTRYETGTTLLAKARARSTLLNAIYRKLLWNGAIKGSGSELLPTVKIRRPGAIAFHDI